MTAILNPIARRGAQQFPAGMPAIPARRRAAMVRRPTPGSVADYARVAARMDEALGSVMERVESLADRIDHRMDRLERDIRSGANETAHLASEVAASRVDAGELRDSVSKLRADLEKVKGQPIEAAAKGAASGAAETIVPVVRRAIAEAQPRSLPKTWWGWLLISAAGIVTLSGALQGLPVILRFIEGVWLTTRGLK